jgi:hypothetical protein
MSFFGTRRIADVAAEFTSIQNPRRPCRSHGGEPMRDTASAGVTRWVPLVVALVLVVTACSASVEDEGVSVDPEAPAADSLPDEAAAPDSGEAVGPSSHGDFSVLYVALADEGTADRDLQLLVDAGLEGFTKEGSVDEGFKVYWPGLTRDQAMQVVIEIASTPDVFGGLVYETADLP